MSKFCNEMNDVLTMVGWLITLFKVAVPVIIIVMGMFDLGQAVIASKDDQIKTSAKRLAFRVVAGIAIFFIPSIVLWVFETIDDYNNSKGGFETCKNALLYPWQ